MSTTLVERHIVDVPQFAELLQVNERTVRRQIAAGEVPGAFRFGVLYRIDLDRFFAATNDAA